jgi:hypothetical protein
MSSGICVVGQERGSEGGSRECGEELRWKCRKMLRIIAGVRSCLCWVAGATSGRDGTVSPWVAGQVGICPKSSPPSPENKQPAQCNRASCNPLTGSNSRFVLLELSGCRRGPHTVDTLHAVLRSPRKTPSRRWCRFPVRLLGASHADSGRTTQSTRHSGSNNNRLEEITRRER